MGKPIVRNCESCKELFIKKAFGFYFGLHHYIAKQIQGVVLFVGNRNTIQFSRGTELATPAGRSSF